MASGESAAGPIAAAVLGSVAFDREVSGGKAARLHALADAGLRVPPGFVVEASVNVDHCSDHELAELVADIGGFPVAVRSSGLLEDLNDASFAGLYETYLDVADISTLRQRIIDCRQSGRTERVTTYLTERGFEPRAAAIAVLVQRMVKARTAGVAFSIDPVSGIEDHGVIECCPGLGDRLVSGHVRPTRLVVRLVDGVVVEHVEGDEEVELSDAEAAELATLLLAAQAHGHRPQDVEWAIDDEGQLWLLQSRPITTIAWRTDIDQFSDANLRDGGLSARVCTPLMFSFYDNAFQPTMQSYFDTLGLLRSEAEPDWMALYYGRPYWNASAVKRRLALVPGYKEEHLDRDLGVMKDYGTPGPLRTPTTAATVARALPVAAALAKLYRRQLEIVDAFAAAWPATYELWRGRADRLQSTDDATFVNELAECLLTWHTDTERTYFTTIYNNAQAQSDLKEMLDKLDRATGGTTSVIDLLVGLSDVSHMALQRGILELYRVAEANGFDGPAWATALDEFIREHGFHSDIELEIMCPRWSEDPDRVTAMIGAMFEAATTPADPDACLPAQQARFDAELGSVRERIRSSPTARLRFGRPLGKHVRRVRSYLVARERMRDFSSRCYAIVRTYVVEAAARLAADGRLDHPDDVFMLSMHELVDLARGNVSGAALVPAIRFRRAMYEGYRDLNPPHELGGGVTQATGPSTSADGRARLVGLACSPGAVEGTARVIRALDEISELRPGDIMVSPYTDPGWTAAMGLVAGVVTEVGGLLCHAAVISREYGIPAVLNVQGATSMLRSGQRVRVDGSAGTVEVLDDVVADAGPVFEATTFQPQARPALTRGKRFICIAGGDGSGKTTQVARVAAAFEADGQQVAPVTIWDAFLDPKIASKLPFEKPGEIYGYLALLDPVARTHFLFHALHLAFALAAERDSDVVVANAYWYKYFATEIAHGGDPAMLRQLAAAFPEPDVTFYLAITPDQSLARKVQRSDYESGYGEGDAAFVEFQQRSHEVLDDLSSELGWIPLDGSAPAAEVTAAILDHLTDR